MDKKKRELIPHKPGIYEKYIKRPQDFILSVIAIIVLSPVLVLIAVLVRIKLGSPVLFKQQRPGLNGKIFNMYKFRTMTDKRDEAGNLLPDEERLTNFGKKLRSTSLDELPELFCIAKGELAICGPRPLLVSYLPLYNEQQVHGRNSVTWEEKFDMDVYYVDHISFLMDWKIIFQTVMTVLKRDGISSETAATMEMFTGTAENVDSSKKKSNR